MTSVSLRASVSLDRRDFLVKATAAAGVSAAVAHRPILDWTEKHRPRTLDELVGNGPAISELKAWAAEWRSGMPKERAAILAGDPGVGKTSAAYALATDMGWGVIELNASDQRNEDVIRRIAGSGAVNRAFGADGSFDAGAGGRQLVILDEADNLFGREDRGGLKAIIETIRETRQPIVLIANDLYELQRKGGALKTLARTIKFSKVHSNSIPPAVRRIAKAEGIMLEPGVDKAIAERAGGDLRSAVNDLQALCAGRTEVTLADVEAMGRRDTTGDVWGMLGKVFYGTDADAARKSTWDLDETPDSIALWIDENLPNMYTDRADLVEGFTALSKADVFLGRVQRRQMFRLWSYAGELMTAGVAVAKHERPARARFQFPSWLRRQSTSKAMRQLRDRTATKVGEVLHTSRSRARQDHFPYLRQLMQGDDKFAAWAAWRFGLEADELAFLLEEKSTSARVKKLVERGVAEHGVPARPAGGGRFGAFEEDAEDGSDALDEEGDNAPSPTKAAAKKAAAKSPRGKRAQKPLVAADEDAESADAPPEAATPSEEAATAEEEPTPKKQRSLMEF